MWEVPVCCPRNVGCVPAKHVCTPGFSQTLWCRTGWADKTSSANVQVDGTRLEISQNLNLLGSTTVGACLASYSASRNFSEICFRHVRSCVERPWDVENERLQWGIVQSKFWVGIMPVDLGMASRLCTVMYSCYTWREYKYYKGMIYDKETRSEVANRLGNFTSLKRVGTVRVAVPTFSGNWNMPSMGL